MKAQVWMAVLFLAMIGAAAQAENGTGPAPATVLGISDDVLDVDVHTGASSTDLLIRPTLLPLGHRLGAYAVLGYSWYDWSIRAEFTGETMADGDNADELIYGLGAAFRLTDRWSVRGEWTNVDVSAASIGRITASLTYRM